MSTTASDKLIGISRGLCTELNAIDFIVDSQNVNPKNAIGYVYNPLDYARSAYEEYVRRFAPQAGAVVFLGMNPGPWGMAQTGIPFGAVHFVRDWMQISQEALRAIGRPAHEAPSKPVLGAGTRRNEVSGMRFWGLMQSLYPRAEDFFRGHFVINYCPLLFTHVEGRRNLTPEKLGLELRKRLYTLCDSAFLDMLNALEPSTLVAVGGFAERRLRKLLSTNKQACTTEKIITILHPSPASPLANTNWAKRMLAVLNAEGILCNCDTADSPAAGTV